MKYELTNKQREYLGLDPIPTTRDKVILKADTYSTLTKAAFCREAGITAAQFTYWCRRFDEERKTIPENQVAELTPSTAGFTQLHLPDSPTSAVHSVCPTPVICKHPTWYM